MSKKTRVLAGHVFGNSEVRVFMKNRQPCFWPVLLSDACCINTYKQEHWEFLKLAAAAVSEDSFLVQQLVAFSEKNLVDVITTMKCYDMEHAWIQTGISMVLLLPVQDDSSM